MINQNADSPPQISNLITDLSAKAHSITYNMMARIRKLRGREGLPSKSFPKFAELPAELRVKIWHFAIFSYLDEDHAPLRVSLHFCMMNSIDGIGESAHQIDSMARGGFIISEHQGPQPLIAMVDRIGLACVEARAEVLREFPTRMRVYRPSPKFLVKRGESRITYFNGDRDALIITDLEPTDWHITDPTPSSVNYTERLLELRNTLESIRSVTLGVDLPCHAISKASNMMLAMKRLEHVYICGTPYCHLPLSMSYGKIQYYETVEDYPIFAELRRKYPGMSLTEALEAAHWTLRGWLIEDLTETMDSLRAGLADADLGLKAADGWTPGMGRSVPRVGIWVPDGE